MATEVFHYPVTWSLWFIAALVPGLCSMLVVPWIVLSDEPTGNPENPEAAAFAAGETAPHGPWTWPTHRRLDISLRLRPLDYVALASPGYHSDGAAGLGCAATHGRTALAGRHKQPRGMGHFHLVRRLAAARQIR